MLAPSFIFIVNKLVLSQYKTRGTGARNSQIVDGTFGETITSMKWRKRTAKEPQKVRRV